MFCVEKSKKEIVEGKWNEELLTGLLKELYSHFNMSFFKDNDDWFLSFSRKSNKEILVKFTPDGVLTDDLIVQCVNELDVLQTVNHDLKNIFIFSSNSVDYSTENNLSTFGIKICGLDYISELIYKAENNIKHIELLAHNSIALKDILNYSKDKNKIGVVRATGTGKSFIIANLIAINKGKKMLLLSPSNLILNQFKKYFGEDFFELFDSITYNKLSKKSSSDVLSTKYDFIFLDEYHRCGASVWESFVKELIDANKDSSKIIGFTATDKRHLDGNRDMTEELFDGNICSELSLTDAISFEILKAPYYVSALYDISEDIDGLKRKIMTTSKSRRQQLIDELNTFKINWDSISSMSNIFKKHLNTSESYKFVVFCKDTAHSKEMSVLLKKWFMEAGFTTVSTSEVNYTTPDRDEIIEHFENDSLNVGSISLLLTVSIFNEGVRCNSSGVIFLRGTSSNIIYSQQLGRALSASGSKTPIVFDLMNNFKNVKRLSLIGDMNNSIAKHNLIRQSFGLNESDFVWDIYDEVKEPLALFESIEKKVHFGWYDWFNEYCKFVKENNTPIILKSNPNTGLYRWVVETRTLFRKELLTEEQIKLLSDIGFVFDVLEEQWVKSFVKWKNFIKDNNREPSTSSDNTDEVSLAKWCFQQRRVRRAGTIKANRKLLLEEAGFNWSLRNQDWDTNIKLMAKQIKERGNSDMTSVDIKNNPLYYWHYKILTDYRDGKLPKEKELELLSIGFSFDKAITMRQRKKLQNDSSISDDDSQISGRSMVIFEKRFNQYIEYVREFSRTNVRDADVKANLAKYKGLYSWYKSIRRNGPKRIKITEEQRKRLQKVGFFD